MTWQGIFRPSRICLANRSCSREPYSVTSPERTTKLSPVIELMSRTAARKSSSPVGEPTCVSLSQAKRNAPVCAPTASATKNRTSARQPAAQRPKSRVLEDLCFRSMGRVSTVAGLSSSQQVEPCDRNFPNNVCVTNRPRRLTSAFSRFAAQRAKDLHEGVQAVWIQRSHKLPLFAESRADDETVSQREVGFDILRRHAGTDDHRDARVFFDAAQLGQLRRFGCARASYD